MQSVLARCVVAFATLISLCAMAASQQSLEQLLAPDPRAFHVDRVCVKLAEGTDAELRAGELVSRAGTDLGAVARWFRTARAEPLVGSVPRAQLDAWHAHACAVLPAGRRPGHLGLWFRLRTDGVAASEALIAALRSEPLVEHVHPEGRFVPASAEAPRLDDIPPTTPSFTALQNSHDPTPLGHGARLVAGVFGARGQGIGLRMIEESYFLGHEDVGKLVAANFLGPVPIPDAFQSRHALSGCSIVCADRNIYGITGLADLVAPKFIGMDVSGGFESSLALALANSQPGDVVLAVLMLLVPGLGPGTWLPVEFLQSVFDATLTVTANGRHVVVPAGNGNRSLDDPALFGRFDRNFRDSGAIMVGASNAGALQRASFSNWGARIDAHSWGAQVVSCGYGDLFWPNNDDLQAYTQLATGTSSATPHIAAVVAAIQGACKRQLGQVLTNQQLLAILRTHGATTPDVIGRRTDLAAAFQALGIFDGLAVGSPEVSIGGVIQVAMNADSNAIFALAGSFAAVDTPIGLNRNLHLDSASMAVLGAFLFPAGQASMQIPVPNNAALHGTSVYLQALRMVPPTSMSLTNSCQVSIL